MEQFTSDAAGAAIDKDLLLGLARLEINIEALDFKQARECALFGAPASLPDTLRKA